MSPTSAVTFAKEAPAPVAVVTNAVEYAGPPIAKAAAAHGLAVLCHSERFASSQARAEYEATYPGLTAALSQTPEDLVVEAVERFGRIDAVVSNDAGDIRQGPFVERDLNDLYALIEVFAVRPVRTALAAVPIMQRQGGGRILFITSGAPLNAPAGMAMYASTRAVPHTLTRSLARELGPHNISVNAIAPFYLQSSYVPEGLDDPMVAARVDLLVPQRRLGPPEQLGELAALLISGTTDFVSGQVIAFSGGGA